MKKILIATGSMNVGGIEKALLEMLQVIPYDRYEIDLFLEEKEGVYLKDVPNKVNVITDEKVAYCLYSSRLKQMLALIKRGKLFSAVDIAYQSLLFLITKNVCGFFNWQAKRMPKLKKHYDVAIAYHNPCRFPTHFVVNNVDADKKIIWNHTDISYNDTNYSGYDKLFCKVDCICNVSNAAKTAFEKIFPNHKNKTRVFYNVINAEKIAEKANEFRVEKYGKPMLLTVGRMSAEKGQDRIPDIALKLKNAGVEFVWYVVGWGSPIDSVRKDVESFGLQYCVIVTGNKENPYPYMQACDIYIQTSWQEGFPMVIGEMLTFNKPCVVTDVGGTMEYFTNPDTVVRVCDNTNDCIADAVKMLLENSEKYDIIQHNLSELPKRICDKDFDCLIDEVLG